MELSVQLHVRKTKLSEASEGREALNQRLDSLHHSKTHAKLFKSLVFLLRFRSLEEDFFSQGLRLCSEERLVNDVKLFQILIEVHLSEETVKVRNLVLGQGYLRESCACTSKEAC